MYPAFHYQHVILLILFLSIYSHAGYIDAQCTVSYFKSNTTGFEKACNTSCKIVNTNHIIRHQCSNDVTEEGYAVYKCPESSSNPTNGMYMANYASPSLCSIYKEVNESCGVQAGMNLTNNPDLLCGCDYFKVDSDTMECVLSDNSQQYCHKMATDFYERILNKTERCNYHDNCVDHLDELGCQEGQAYGLYCDEIDPEKGYARFVSAGLRCNGNSECPGDKDEEDCKEGMYCLDDATKFIPDISKCDYWNDCKDGSDESESACPKNYCNSTRDGTRLQLGHELRCNGTSECTDSLDEKNCVAKWGSGLQCDTDGSKYVMIDYICDGVKNCEDGKDELEYENCTRGEMCPYGSNSNSTVYRFCKQEDWCTTKTSCSSRKWFCPNGTSDSFERCSKPEYSGRGHNCTVDGEMKWFHKDNIKLCAGTSLCDDHSDQMKPVCQGLECVYNKQESNGTRIKKVVKYSKLCSNRDQNECKDGEDLKCDSDFCGKDSNDKCAIPLPDKDQIVELFFKHRIFACDENMLNISLYPLNTVKRTEYMDSYCMNEKFFQCERTGGVTTKRIPMEWLGDGFKDCIDGSDEDTSPEGKFTMCSRKGYREDGKLITAFPNIKRCDNSKDCSDNSDEIVGCSKDGLKCRNSDGEQIIIKKDYICDGVKDCFSGEDESPCGDKRSTNETCTKGDDCVSLYTFLSLSEAQTLTLEQKDGPEEFKVKTNDMSCAKIGKEYIASVCGTTNSCKKNQTCPESTKISDAVKQCSNESVYYRVKNGNEYEYQPYLYLMNKNQYYSRVFMCNTAKACAIPLDEACDLNNDCGDWSDEKEDKCPNNFMCKDTSLYIERAQLCDSQIDCPDGSDECDDSCDQNVLNNPKRILGAVALLAVVWILGIFSLCLNCLLIISMSRSAFIVLREAPHRFIYRSLVTTIAIGDMMVSVYLVTLAGVDSFRPSKYCEIKEKWLTGFGCSFLGFISTFGNHIALFAMLALSLFRLKTVKDYLWPRTLNSSQAIRISQILIFCIVLGAGIISAVPLIPSWEDYFVQKYYFPNKGRFFGTGSKAGLSSTLHSYYNDDDKLNSTFFGNNTWNHLIHQINYMFTDNNNISKPGGHYSFYSSNGVCLFNYFTDTANQDFGFVISVIVLNLICFLAIVVAYFGIWIIGSKNSRGSDAEKRLQMKITIVVIFNIICRVPLFTLCMVNLAVDNRDNSELQLIYPFVSALVIPLPSVINPVVNSESSLFDHFAKFKASLDCETQFKTQIFGLSTVNANPVATGVTEATDAGESYDKDLEREEGIPEEIENVYTAVSEDKKDSECSNNSEAIITSRSPLTGRRHKGPVVGTLPPIENRRDSDMSK